MERIIYVYYKTCKWNALHYFVNRVELTIIKKLFSKNCAVFKNAWKKPVEGQTRSFNQDWLLNQIFFLPFTYCYSDSTGVWRETPTPDLYSLKNIIYSST